MTNQIDNNDVSPSMRINQLYWGFVISRAIHVAAKLGVADFVDDKGVHVREIKNKIDFEINEDRLYRLMRMLASYEIFEELEKYTFKSTPLSDAIKTDEDQSVRFAAHLVTKSMWEAYGELEYSIKTGEDKYNKLFGMGVFDLLEKNPDESKQFDKAMHNFSEGENKLIAGCCNLENINHVVDIGGGYGGFLEELMSLKADVKGLLYDQEHVIDKVGIEHVNKAGFEKQAGDFFESVPQGFDAYVLKRILHDWSDSDCSRILQSCAKAMNQASKLFIVDAVVPNGNVSHFSKDLEVFLITWGGQERDRDEFEGLLHGAGLKINNIYNTPTVLSIIEAQKL
jgi:O-methyltransferase